MADFLTSKAAVILCIFIIVVSRLFVALVVYINCKDKDKYLRTVLTLLSIAFSIITGIVSAAECKRNPKKVVSIIISLIIYFSVSLSAISVLSYNISYNQSEKYYDREGNAFLDRSEVTFQDTDGNEYSYNFDKSGYDYLYINGTQKRLNSDLCYIDIDGYLHYDEDMSILVKDSTCCVDEDGYLVYDNEQSFTGEKNEDGFDVYTSPDGSTYYWASSISWDKDGKRFRMDTENE